MYRKRIAAFIMTSCLLTNIGCSSTGSGSGTGLFSGGCCGHNSSSGGGLFSRMFGSSPAPTMAAGPVVSGPYSGGYAGVDCPCSNKGNEGMFHPAVLTQNGPIMAGPGPGMNAGMGDMNAPQGMPGSIYPQPQFPTQPIPVTTPGLPPGMNPGVPSTNPGMPQLPMQGQPPRIQPIPAAPPTGVAPSGGMAPATTWSGQH